MGPDEDHVNVTNNVFTNVVAKYALEFGEMALTLCNNHVPIKTIAWAEIANNIKILYDRKLDYHPQYENYQPKIVIKQADAVLLGYPLLYPMNHTTRRNDLLFYEQVTRNTGPAMTWAMHSINYLDIGDNSKADKNFLRGFEDYIRPPFQVWSEVITKHEGAINFLTGAGGFLQSLIYGYAGIRLYFDHMEVRKPIMPPNSTKFSISGIKYLGTTFKITVDDDGALIRCLTTDDDQPLEIVDEYDKYDITPYIIYNITFERIIIKPKNNVNFGNNNRFQEY